MGDSPDAPPPPDYTGAAQATAKGNVEAVRAQTAANRISQYTPYGSLEYNRDPNAKDEDSGWSSTLKLSPEQQKLLDQQNKTSLGLANLSDKGVSYVDKMLSNQIEADDLPANMVNPGQTGQDALMSRFQPMMDTSRSALKTQLANQGISEGSEAFTNAMRTQNQGENDLRVQAALNGINVGQNAQNQQLGLLTALQNNPINVLNAVRTGSQVTNPTFTNTPQQQNAGGVDYMGAAKGNADYSQGLYNSQVASANAQNSSMMSLLGTGALAYAML
jgi:hypothetical protein